MVAALLSGNLVLSVFLRQQVEMMEGGWGSWGMLGGKGFEALMVALAGALVHGGSEE